MEKHIAKTLYGGRSVTAFCRSCSWTTTVEPHDNAAAHTMHFGHDTGVVLTEATYYVKAKETTNEGVSS